MIRKALTFAAACLMIPLLRAQGTEEKDVMAVVQRVFDGMAAHDSDMVRSGMLADAELYSVRDDAAPKSASAGDFVARLATLKGDLLERFTGHTVVSVSGRIAEVWGEYEFLRDGKFVHCGVDSFSLFRTPDGWKIATVTYTAETKGCAGH